MRSTAPVLIYLTAAGVLSLTGRVLADDECGVVVGASAIAVCDGIANNTDAAQGAVNVTPGSDAADASPLASGISYSNLNGFTLNVQNGVVITRTSGPGEDGIHLVNTTSAPLAINLSTGVKIDVDGKETAGVLLMQTSNGAINIQSGADIIADNPDPDPDNEAGANGLFGWINSTSSTASISIEQLAGSTVETTGHWSFGLYGFNRGQGSVALTSSGTITTAGYYSYGMNAFNQASAGATGDVTVDLTASGSIITDGGNAVGMYALNYGDGGASVTAAGSVETKQGGADAVLAYVNSNGPGATSVDLSSSASLITRGNGANGAWALSGGMGTVTLALAGKVQTYGNSSTGLRAQISNATNSQPILLTMSTGASVSTSGNSATGIYATHAGGGQVTIDLGGGAYVTTSGNGSAGALGKSLGIVDIAIAGAVATSGNASSGVTASSSGDTAKIVQTAGSTITATGANSAGVWAAGDTGATLASNGTVAANGEFGVAMLATTQSGAAEITIGAGTTATGGWQATTSGLGGTLGVKAAGVQIGSGGTSLLTNYGTIRAGSDRAIGQTGTAGNLLIENHGTVIGFIELAGSNNVFNNHSFNSFDIRHFADTDVDGIPDTKRVAISNFGGAGSVFNNLAPGAVRFLDVAGAATTDTTNFYLPSTGTNNRALDSGFYDLTREGVVQGQFTNLAIFNNAGLIDLRGTAVGNTLVMTDQAAAGGPAGNGMFVSNGGALYLNVMLNAGIPLAGQTGSNSDMLIVDGTQLGTGATMITVTNKGGLALRHRATASSWWKCATRQPPMHAHLP